MTEKSKVIKEFLEEKNRKKSNLEKLGEKIVGIVKNMCVDCDDEEVFDFFLTVDDGKNTFVCTSIPLEQYSDERIKHFKYTGLPMAVDAALKKRKEIQ